MSDKQLHLFMSNIPSSRYIFKNGKVANFVGGIYTTSIASEIEELDSEVDNGHPHISIDSSRRVISADELDPMVALKKKLRAEILAEQAAINPPGRDFGQSDEGKQVGLQTSASIAPVTAGSQGIAAGSIKVASAPK